MYDDSTRDLGDLGKGPLGDKPKTHVFGNLLGSRSKEERDGVNFTPPPRHRAPSDTDIDTGPIVGKGTGPWGRLLKYALVVTTSVIALAGGAFGALIASGGNIRLPSSNDLKPWVVETDQQPGGPPQITEVRPTASRTTPGATATPKTPTVAPTTVSPTTAAPTVPPTSAVPPTTATPSTTVPTTARPTPSRSTTAPVTSPPTVPDPTTPAPGPTTRPTTAPTHSPSTPSTDSPVAPQPSFTRSAGDSGVSR